MRRSMILLAAAAIVAACDGEDTLDPQDRVLATGTYEYEGRWLHPATMEWDTITGELVVDAITPDSVHGRWIIQGFLPDQIAGYWNENAYVLNAVSNNGQVTVRNRLSRIGSPSDLLCTLSFLEDRPSAGEPWVTGGTCDADPTP
jgi:hypothetical protein